jgi:hypothetical protein
MFNKSKSKQQDTSSSTGSSTVTQTPVVNGQYGGLWNRYMDGIGSLMDGGQPLSPGASPLLEQAFAGAAGLNQPQTVPMVGGGMAGAGVKADPNLGPQVNGGPGDGVAPVTNGLMAGGGARPSNYDIASLMGLGAGLAGPNVTGPAAQGSASVFSQEGIQSRLSPYLSQVVDASLADYDTGVGRDRAQADLAASRSGGAWNSNNAIASALRSENATRGRGTLSATLRDQGFGRAADILGRDNDRETQASLANAQMANQLQMFNAGQQDTALNRMLSAAGLLPQIASAEGANSRANIGLQADLGQQQREIEQSQTEAARMAQLAQLLGFVPTETQVGQTRSGTESSTGTGTRTGSSSGFGLSLNDIFRVAGAFG